jgi:hypothetical protein
MKSEIIALIPQVLELSKSKAFTPGCLKFFDKYQKQRVAELFSNFVGRKKWAVLANAVNKEPNLNGQN